MLRQNVDLPGSSEYPTIDRPTVERMPVSEPIQEIGHMAVANLPF